MGAIRSSHHELPLDFPDRIRRLRAKLGLTQTGFAELMGVSFASVNRWENGQSRPAALAWQQIIRTEKLGMEALRSDGELLVRDQTGASPDTQLELLPAIDFATAPEIVWAVAEGERLTYGHLFNPTFATETSLIEPLPHQRIAVYEHLAQTEPPPLPVG